MKLKFHNPVLFFAAIACCAGFTLNTARADGNDDEQGGDINGSESLGIEIALTPTAAAPSGSSIKASLEADDQNGVTNARLKLESEGLPAGTYSVGVTLKSDGSTVQLGTFTVTATPTPTPSPTPTPTATPTNGGSNDDDGDEDGNDDGQDENGDDNGGNSGQGDCEFGNGTSLPFPAGFNPFDIATIFVTDSNNVVLFTADLTNTAGASSMSFTANVLATPGAGNPGVTGTAALTSAVTSGHARGSLQLSAHGLPARTSFTFAANGSPLKNVTSNKRGDVNVMLNTKGKTSTLPGGLTLSKITSVGLHDKTGQLIIGASF